MRESRFKLTIEHTEKPSVIVPIKISEWTLNPEFDKATHGFERDMTEIKVGPPPKSPLPPPTNDSEQVNKT